MDLRINPENEALIERAREFARDVLATYADECDQEQRFPRESFDALIRAGFTRLTLPESYGGRALWSDPVCYAMVFHELSQGCTNTAMTLHMHSSILYFLLTLSDEEQKHRFAEAARNGAIFGSHAGEAASSPQWNRTITTRARKEGDEYVINGQKYFCSMAGEADHYVLWCLLEDVEELQAGLRWAVLDKNLGGITIPSRWDAFAMRGTASHSLAYEDVRVPARNIVGTGEGILQPDFVPRFGLGYAAVYLGAGAAALDWIVDYALKRKLLPDNVPIASYPAIQRQIGEMKIAYETALIMIQKAAWVLETEGAAKAIPFINEAKYTASEAAASMTEKALKIAGGPGLLNDKPLQRFHRDARAALVMPPSTEKCLQMASNFVLSQNEAASIF